MMNKKGNLMINLLFFVMALGVLVMFVSPIKAFVDYAQQSDGLNCYGYVYGGNANNPLSFNASLNNNQSGSAMTCLAIKLYLPYIFLAFLIAGVTKLLYERSASSFSIGEDG